MTKQEAIELGWAERAEAFAHWYSETNNQCKAISGLNLRDIEDFDYATAFEAGDLPRDTALAALAEAGFPVDDLPFSEPDPEERYDF